MTDLRYERKKWRMLPAFDGWSGSARWMLVGGLGRIQDQSRLPDVPNRGHLACATTLPAVFSYTLTVRRETSHNAR